MKNRNQIYYIRQDTPWKSVVFKGTFEQLKWKVFQKTLEQIKEKSKKPFFWPRDVEQLVRTLNYGTSVLGQPLDFYALTTEELANKKHWPILEQDEQLN